MKSVGLWGAIVWLAISATDLSRPLFSVVHWGSWSLSPNYYALDDLRFTCVIEASIKSTFCMLIPCRELGSNHPSCFLFITVASDPRIMPGARIHFDSTLKSHSLTCIPRPTVMVRPLIRKWYTQIWDSTLHSFVSRSIGILFLEDIVLLGDAFRK